MTATLESSSFSEVAVEARYVVDGVERGIGGTQNVAANRPGPWEHFCVLDGSTSPTDVVFQLRDSGGTGTIAQLRAVAMPLPETADAQYATQDPIQSVTSLTYTNVASFTVMPASAGDYLVLLLANLSEAPGASNITSQWLDPSGTPWNNDMFNPRKPWQSVLLMRRITLAAGPSTITLQSYTNAQAGVRYVRVLALRTDGIPAFAFAHNATPATTTVQTPTITSSLAPVNGTAPAYVAFLSARVESDPANGALLADRGIHFTIDGTETSIRHVNDNHSYESSYGSVHLLGARPTSLSTGYSSGNGAIVLYLESSIVVLGSE